MHGEPEANQNFINSIISIQKRGALYIGSQTQENSEKPN